MPGKFEGQPSYVEYFYDLTLQGDQDYTFIDSHDLQIDVINIDSTDRAREPDLEGETHIVIYEDEQGFVGHELANGRDDLRDVLSTMGVADWQLDEDGL